MQQITVTSLPGRTSISGDFLERSTATGILAVVYTPTGHESDTLSYYLLVPRSYEQQRASAVFECIPSGIYSTSFFSVESSGLPFSRAATKVRALSVDQERNVDCVGEYRHDND